VPSKQPFSFDQMDRLQDIARKAGLTLEWDSSSPSVQQTANGEVVLMSFMLKALRATADEHLLGPQKLFELACRQLATYLFSELKGADFSAMVGGAVTHQLHSGATPTELAREMAKGLKRGIAQWILPVALHASRPKQLEEAQQAPIQVLDAHLEKAQELATQLGLDLDPVSQVKVPHEDARSLMMSLRVMPPKNEEDQIAPMKARVTRFAHQMGELLDDLFRQGMVLSLATNKGTVQQIEDPASFEQVFKDHLLTKLVQGVKGNIILRVQMP